ncbi:MAG: hypothetical protein K9N55_07105 [Phycisphaerae bacterium]|nr:hypothetical protein [Phycisphaerae bacterium]
MGQLSPSARALDQDMLIFEAGRASQGSNRPWKAMCGILMGLLCGSLILHVPQTEPVTPTTVVQQIPAPMSPVDMPQPHRSLAYLQLQKTVLDHGLDALPPYRAVRKINQKQLDQETLLQDLMTSDEVTSGLL